MVMAAVGLAGCVDDTTGFAGLSRDGGVDPSDADLNPGAEPPLPDGPNIGDLSCPRAPREAVAPELGPASLIGKTVVELPWADPPNPRSGYVESGPTAVLQRVCGPNEPGECGPGAVVFQNNIVSWHPDGWTTRRPTVRGGATWLLGERTRVVGAGQAVDVGVGLFPQRSEMGLTQLISSDGIDVWNGQSLYAMSRQGYLFGEHSFVDEYAIAAFATPERQRLAVWSSQQRRTTFEQVADETAAFSIAVDREGDALGGRRWFCWREGNRPIVGLVDLSTGSLDDRIEIDNASCRDIELLPSQRFGLFLTVYRAPRTEIIRLRPDREEIVGDVIGRLSVLDGDSGFYIRASREANSEVFLYNPNLGGAGEPSLRSVSVSEGFGAGKVVRRASVPFRAQNSVALRTLVLDGTLDTPPAVVTPFGGRFVTDVLPTGDGRVWVSTNSDPQESLLMRFDGSIERRVLGQFVHRRWGNLYEVGGQRPGIYVDDGEELRLLAEGAFVQLVRALEEEEGGPAYFLYRLPSERRQVTRWDGAVLRPIGAPAEVIFHRTDRFGQTWVFRQDGGTELLLLDDRDATTVLSSSVDLEPLEVRNGPFWGFRFRQPDACTCVIRGPCHRLPDGLDPSTLTYLTSFGAPQGPYGLARDAQGRSFAWIVGYRD